MSEAVALGRRHTFLVEADDLPDTLLRVLTPFAVQSASLANVVLSSGERSLSIRIEADGLDSRRAETLLARLRGLPVVRSVGIGWRGVIPADRAA